ncbi:reverse transcriptase domain-containing protein [Trichonephila clavipes]|nr:reverse transcriptase domain-containing protein [Trichonephila clavipes]
MTWLIENKVLHFYQAGYRAKHSNVDQLSYLVQTIIDGLQEKSRTKRQLLSFWISLRLLYVSGNRNSLRSYTVLALLEILCSGLTTSLEIENLSIKIFNSTINQISNPKYLSLTLDTELRFTKHIEATSLRALKKLNILRKLCGRTWGSKTKTLLNTYNTIVRPVLKYAAPIWAPASSSSKEKI